MERPSLPGFPPPDVADPRGYVLRASHRGFWWISVPTVGSLGWSVYKMVNDGLTVGTVGLGVVVAAMAYLLVWHARAEFGARPLLVVDHNGMHFNQRVDATQERHHFYRWQVIHSIAFEAESGEACAPADADHLTIVRTVSGTSQVEGMRLHITPFRPDRARLHAALSHYAPQAVTRAASDRFR